MVAASPSQAWLRMGAIVATRTPLRVSFFGGGTDLADYYRRGYGAVISTTIDKYVYVTVKPHGALFDEVFRLNYSKTEQAASVEEIENEIARESIRLCKMRGPLYISTVADVPSGSGLGSSSSFAVGLLHAFYMINGRRITPGELAASACRIEIDVLGKPIGKQDQFAAAYGGLNHFRFNADERVSITPISLSAENTDLLFSSFLLFWTGVSRRAEDVLSHQRARAELNISTLDSLRCMADDACDLLHGDKVSVQKFGELLNEAWELKRRLSSRISDDQISHWYQRGVKAGAYGGKLCGAGGGGFLLFCAPKEKHSAMKAALSDLKSIDVAYDRLGTRVLFPGYAEG
jgi:D-glycero-alpha-D-manno-heptose-7-phosphate kinase